MASKSIPIFILGIILPLQFLLGEIQNKSLNTPILYEDIQNACGISSVYMALRLEGINVNYEQLMYEMNYLKISNDGVNILNIEYILNKYGISYTVKKMSYTEMSCIQDGLFILYDYPAKEKRLGHFLIVRNLGNSILQFIDPPHKSECVNSNYLINTRNVVIVIGNSKIPFFDWKYVILGGILLLAGLSIIVFMLYGKTKKKKNEESL